MNKFAKRLLGLFSAVALVLGGALLASDSGYAKDPDRCPATSKAKCDGLMIKRLGV